MNGKIAYSLLLTVASVGVEHSSVPMPPYSRTATVQVFSQRFTSTYAVQGNVFYSLSQGCVAYSLPTMSKLWTTNTNGGQFGRSFCAGKGVLLISSPGDRFGKVGTLACYDAKTGQLRWTIARTCGSSPVAVTGNTAYVSLKPSSVSAVDVRTHKVLWTTPIPRPDKPYESLLDAQCISATDGFVALGMANISYCLNSKSGEILWSQPQTYLNSEVYGERLTITPTYVCMPYLDGLIVRDLRTGRVLVKKPDKRVDQTAAIGNRIIVLGSGKVSAFDVTSGAKLWSHEVGPSNRNGGNQYLSVLQDRIFVVGADKALICDAKGHAFWSGKADDALPTPIWLGGNQIVCFDGTRLMSYVHSGKMQMPVDSPSKRALATKLAAQIDQLDPREIAQLKALGDHAFSPLLDAFLSASAQSDTNSSDANKYQLYSRSRQLGDSLETVTTRKHAGQLLSLLTKRKDLVSALPKLVHLLAKVGDPKDVTPYFIHQLEGNGPTDHKVSQEVSFISKLYVVTSSDPRAVQFMIRQLRDPKADPELRNEAYLHLAGTGGEEGLRAVLAERKKRTLIRPLAQRVTTGWLDAEESGKKSKVLAEKTDKDGRVWGLLESEVLGSAGDLWLAEKVDGHWSNPLYTGVSTMGVSTWAKPRPKEPTFAGKTAKQLLAGDWFTLLVGNPELSRDSDGDGLTDIVEKRLGTNPNRKDTDGDGVPDEIDPWPNAAPRTLSDAEQVLDAAFEARFHDEDGEGPALFFAPREMKPFEMVGRQGPTLWVVDDDNRKWSTPLEQCYEHGIAFIHFDQMVTAPGKPWEERFIKWNRTHTEATVMISVYSGGLSGAGYEVVVRKFGKDWVVISMRMAYIS